MNIVDRAGDVEYYKIEIIAGMCLGLCGGGGEWRDLSTACRKSAALGRDDNFYLAIKIGIW